jgi:hypothetical protein
MVDVIAHESDCQGFDNERARAEGVCRSYCALHHKCEPNRKDDFTFCGECWHVFRTAKELVDTYMQEAPPRDTPRPRPEAEDIAFCPLCLHDF